MGVHDDLMSFRMDKPLAKVGVTGLYLAKKIKAELEAKETKFFQHEGEVTETRDVTAWSVRQRARQDAHKLRGDYPAEKHEMTGPAGAPLIPPESQEHREFLKEMAKEIASRRIQSDRRTTKKR